MKPTCSQNTNKNENYHLEVPSVLIKTNYLRMKIYLQIIIFILSFQFVSYSQTLNLPPRQQNALTGSEVVSLITNYSLTNRENEIWSQITGGNVPAFQRNLVPVTTTATINNITYTVIYYAVPDYMAVGCDTNYFLCPMTPLLAQRIADFCGCTMPTRKMVNQIWTAATVKLAPSTIPPSSQMTTIPVMNQHNTTVWGQRSAVLETHPLGELTGGDKKDVVISNIIYGYPSPGRVVIYGWHYQNGTPIQPMYNGHEETYADYSHGIRLVQNAITVNGTSNTVTGILQSSTLYSLLSDEGVISIPHYPTSVTVPTVITPTVFALKSESISSIRLIIQNDPNTTHYKIQLSDDGLNFSNTQYLPLSNTVITGLLNNHLYFVRVAAIGIADSSAYSEILGTVTSDYSPQTIIVSGFDRIYTGNTYNFIIQHGNAFYNNTTSFNSATNEAITTGLVNLTDYKIADYMLGNESTANETFSTSEQAKVKTFLEGGGSLFISGAEIAWDLDHLGSTDDKDFYNNYLKAIYVNDAPNGQANTFYQCQPIAGNIFEGIENINFDNGTHGTYNVSYPDLISGMNGGINCLAYTDVASGYGGITFNGFFPNGTQPGKLVNLGFPFETIYQDSTRNHVIKKILDFFDVQSNMNMPFINKNSCSVFPNPVENISYISIIDLTDEINEINIFDITGNLITANKNLFSNKYSLNKNNFKKGIYFYKIFTKKESEFSGKFIITD